MKGPVPPHPHQHGFHFNTSSPDGYEVLFHHGLDLRFPKIVVLSSSSYLWRNVSSGFWPIKNFVSWFFVDTGHFRYHLAAAPTTDFSPSLGIVCLFTCLVTRPVSGTGSGS